MRTTRCVLLLVAGSVTVGLTARETTANRLDEGGKGQLLRAFDAELQRRFLDTSRGFGAARVMTTVPSPHRLSMTYRFVPENDAERDAVSRLVAARIDMMFYLGSASLPERSQATPLTRTTDLTALARLTEPGVPAGFVAGLPWRQRPALQGPVTVVHHAATAPPAVERLLDDSRRLFVVLKTEDVVQFRKDGWEMVARPVRAANGSCVVCHNGNPARPSLPDGSLTTYKPGDVLGVLLYALRSAD